MTIDVPPLELSTRLLIAEAGQRGVEVDILDADDNFVRLRRGSKVEYIKQATRTSADTYIAALLMENKSVTKQLLHEAGLPVPDGFAVHSVEEARRFWPRLKGAGIVIKPRSTNFGEGVYILRTADWTPPQAEEAVAAALRLDSVVLLEAFIQGPEYRFLVIGDETVAVLQRIPANVCGDGLRSIRQLVAEKNLDPRRGSGYHTPLEQIRLTETEAAYLAAQGLDFDSILPVGKRVLLRENSNISTGGDSIDHTDAVHPGYKAAAVAAARAVGAKICGADIIIPDLHTAPTPHNYAFIELNFNPALHIHDYPYEGQNRKVEGYVLDLLGYTRQV